MAVEGPPSSSTQLYPRKEGNSVATTAASATQSYLRDARLQAGYASRDMAAIKLNYSPETIGRHERGDVPVSPDDIIRYAEGYQRPDIMLRYCASCPVGKKTGKRAVDRDLPWAALRVSQRLQKAKEIDRQARKHCRRRNCRPHGTRRLRHRTRVSALPRGDYYRYASLGDERETEKSRPAATETALVMCQGRRPP